MDETKDDFQQVAHKVLSLIAKEGFTVGEADRVLSKARDILFQPVSDFSMAQGEKTLASFICGS